ncbi:MAG: hypothetical protein WDW38_006887 [Sanguina aurantia]
MLAIGELTVSADASKLDKGGAKPDMQACRMMSEMTSSPIPPPSHGHGCPRAALGQGFNGKGELRATGLHSNLNGGISFPSAEALKAK